MKNKIILSFLLISFFSINSIYCQDSTKVERKIDSVKTIKIEKAQKSKIAKIGKKDSELTQEKDIEKIEANISKNKAKIKSLKKEISDDIESLHKIRLKNQRSIKQRMKYDSDFRNNRTENRTDIKDMRNELKELKQEIKSLKEEIKKK